MSQKKIITYATGAFSVAVGVMLAGYIMNEFRDNQYVAKASEGFQGI